ncbi:MAG: glycosyltransferase [Thermoplasmata archaeon]|nr:glycosyltransferase [Candidatus Sysuiplasma jiujiangense]
MQSKAISVIVPVWNNPEGISILLRSINADETDEIEILVVDRVRDATTSSICDKEGAKYLICAEGRSAAKNLGFEKSFGDYVMFLDSDMTLEKGTISRCIHDAVRHDALCLREKVITGCNYWARARAIERNAMYMSGIFESVRLIRKDVFKSVGGYDEHLEGFEDLDMHARIIEHGYSVGWTEATILHNEEDVGFVSYLSKRKKYASGREIYASRHPVYWKELKSFRRRLKLIDNALQDYRPSEALYLLPGLLVIRSFEFLDSLFGF